MGARTTGGQPGGVAFDPFEPGFDAWPYEQYGRLRDQDPVHWSDLLCGWVLTSYEDVTAVLRDPRVSSSLDRAKPSAVVDLLRARQAGRDGAGLTLVLRDGPEHARLRRALQAPFTARSIERLRRSIEERVDALITDLAARHEIELIADLAYPLPVAVVCEMLGIPEEEGPRFREWTAAVAQSLDLVISEGDYDRCMERIGEMEDYLTEAADAKRRRPMDDVLTRLVQAEVDGAPLSPVELVAQLVTLYVAGHEPTTALIGNGTAALLAHPDQLELLQSRPQLIPDAVQELLRYDGPNQFVRRTVVEPMTIGGHGVEVGDVLYVGVGAANHDPARWGPDADGLRVDRPDAGQHVQFGGGVHHCLGAHLARAQAEVALTALLTRLGRLEPAGDVVWSGRMTLRSVAAVPLRLHPSPARAWIRPTSGWMRRPLPSPARQDLGMRLDVATLRADTPGCAEVVHLNNAGAALMPAPVVDAVVDHLRLEARIGGYEAAAAAHDGLERPYDAIAQLLGAQRHEIALVENATRAWDMAFYALRFGPGDRIVTSTAEYASNAIALLQVARRTGAVIDVVPDDESGQLSLDALERTIGDRTRLIAITHVPTQGGLVNPAAEVGALARAAGVVYLLDACQAVGQLPVDVGAIGCDFLDATGRKFLRGPRGTGFLYVRDEWIEQLEPPFLDLRAATWVSAERYEIRSDARRFETWESCAAGRIGLGVAVDYALALGIDQIEARITQLAERLRELLAAVPGVDLHDQGARLCGIVTFSVAGRTATDVATALRAQGINVSVTGPESARYDFDQRALGEIVRASVHCYNTDAELDRLVAALPAA